MRLLDTSTIKLREFIGDEVPRYAILSHTWGEEEVSYQGLSGARDTKGFQKILRCCSLAKLERYEYVWIDTCCIDKTSSAELSEAINSMYRWYADAAVCYAHLADVSVWLDLPNAKGFEESRWFSRGWTLQELLAPQTVVFYDHDWYCLGTRASLEDEICSVCRISKDHILRPMDACIAAKMSWVRALSRNFLCLEYCILGKAILTVPYA